MIFATVNLLFTAALAALLAAPQSPAQPPIIIEAENASIVSPAAAVSADGARAGRAVRINDGPAYVRMDTAGRTNLPHSTSVADLGQISFPFDIDRTGYYTVWVRVQWHCPCSPFLNIRTSGKYIGPADDPLATGLFTSPSRPLVWHWANAGAYEFDPGPQYVRLIQRGHFSLIDTFALSADPQYRPPGYTEPDTSFQLAGPDDWENPPEPLNGRIPFVDPAADHPDVQWADFSLEICFPINADQQSFAFYICNHADDAYTVAFDSTDTLRGSLTKRLGGAETCLAKWATPERPVPWNAVRLERVRGEIAIWLNGARVALAYDDSIPAGQCGICAASQKIPEFHDLIITSIRVYEEYFTAGAPNWKPLAGDWRVVQEPAGPCYVAQSDQNPAVSAAPWAPAESARISCSARLLQPGAAGIAFDIDDQLNFSAFVIRANDDGSSAYDLIASQAGKIRPVWTQPANIPPDQWVTLQIEKQPGAVFLSADELPLAAIELPHTAASAAGLVAAQNACAQFTSVRCRDTIPTLRHTYVFEPPGDYTSLAYWIPIQGKFELVPHPGRLAITSDGPPRARLAWRMPVDTPLDVRVTVRQALVNPSMKSLIPDLPLPPLPGDPRIGISFTPDDNPHNAIAVSTDAVKMRDILIQSGDKTLAHQTSSHTASTAETTLELILDSHHVAASTPAAKTQPIPHNLPNIKGTLHLTADNLTQSPIQITRIQITQTP